MRGVTSHLAAVRLVRRTRSSWAAPALTAVLVACSAAPSPAVDEADHGRAGTPHAAEFSPRRQKASLVCPYAIERGPRFAAEWPHCTVDMSIANLAAWCADGHSCMRPCRTESGDAGEPPDTVLRFSYDAAGRLVAWTMDLRALATRQVFGVEYDPSGKVLGSTPDSDVAWKARYRGELIASVELETDDTVSVTEYDYGPSGLLAAKRVHAGGAPPYEARYNYDAAGLVARVSEGHGGDVLEHRMSYDEGRLVRIDGAHSSAELSYSDGERLACLRMTGEEASETRYAYDGTGRLISEETVETGGGRHMTRHVYDCP